MNFPVEPPVAATGSRTGDCRRGGGAAEATHNGQEIQEAGGRRFADNPGIVGCGSRPVTAGRGQGVVRRAGFQNVRAGAGPVSRDCSGPLPPG